MCTLGSCRSDTTPSFVRRRGQTDYNKHTVQTPFLFVGPSRRGQHLTHQFVINLRRFDHGVFVGIGARNHRPRASGGIGNTPCSLTMTFPCTHYNLDAHESSRLIEVRFSTELKVVQGSLQRTSYARGAACPYSLSSSWSITCHRSPVRIDLLPVRYNDDSLPDHLRCFENTS